MEAAGSEGPSGGGAADPEHREASMPLSLARAAEARAASRLRRDIRKCQWRGQLVRQPQHEVQVEDCRLRLGARALHLPAPLAFQLSGRPCGRRALVSGMPPGLGLSADQLLDKLELFFCKASRGGGEVTARELLLGGRAAVLDFAEDGVVDRLYRVGWFQVPLGKRTVTLAVTPHVSGEVSNLELGHLQAPRTVLLSGVADVMEESTLRDVLELHFQRPSCGGGEVEALVYVAPGRQGYALFTPEIH
ncbi:interferon-induced 35 kDa protein isoform X2 [Ornithorhynchus anatinus]|uniref:interferon-induced 35 kDa protein isoform X2 n=1 Tax=Ornithorhynchus anatinus TaxID=9258 RepID=UPI0010A93FA3|nr:interferon-induced 35 kDa protein isoform X2 [Ornithorhynchus anatinus]